MNEKNLCWLRRDLRLHDHHALSRALNEGRQTYVCFIFDTEILTKLGDKRDRRITFIYDSLIALEKKLQKFGSSLIIRYGNPVVEVPRLIKELGIDALYFNRDYEPYAKARDEAVTKALLKEHKQVHHFKDHVVYEKNEIHNGSGRSYQVFTPYKQKWLDTLNDQAQAVAEYRCPLRRLASFKNPRNILLHDWWQDIPFEPVSNELKAGSDQALKILKAFKKIMLNYHLERDYYCWQKTSKLSAYLRMGNLSVRDMVRAALEVPGPGARAWLIELIWRDFYQMILDDNPQLVRHAYKRQYDGLEWRGSKKDFLRWCEGTTGYPIVDAAMRCLNATGFMHNRLRMVVASFLVKTLQVDWKKGERYFAAKLLDYDLAANNGGWQWSASTGVDCCPYFRIFNPYKQSEKFDPRGMFIRQWCPELRGFSDREIHAPQDTDFPAQDRAQCFIGKDYPWPVVSYKRQKETTLQMYKKVCSA